MKDIKIKKEVFDALMVGLTTEEKKEWDLKSLKGAKNNKHIGLEVTELSNFMNLLSLKLNNEELSIDNKDYLTIKWQWYKEIKDCFPNDAIIYWNESKKFNE
ncbi:MAG: hypothetical protein HRT99_04280 [Mycoplasmatales bacterium]|nr:hypothetical protein [Mycoplasmatales bacterium]